MIYLVIGVILFFAMALLPITSSLIALRRKPGEELIIPNLSVEDPKYFTDLYRSAFKYKWANMGAENIVKYSFKKNEKIIEADKTIEYPVICNNIIYAENYDFVPPIGISFQKEIYTNKNAYLIGIKSVNGVYCKQALHLGQGIDVVRWIDAGGEITIENDCSLGIVTSSNTRIMVGENCLFTKMLAPQIFLGFSEGDDYRSVEKSLICDESFSENEIIRDIKYLDDEMTDENKEIHKTVISKEDVSVIDGIQVKGDIRSHKSVRVGDNAVVYGNIFAEDDIHLGQNCKVLGNVFTQGNVFCESNVMVGQAGKVKSIVAREKIVFDKRCVVYGYIESENICEVCLNEPVKENEDES